MKVFHWAIVFLAWIFAIAFGIAMADGIARGNTGWAIVGVFAFAGMLHITTNRIEKLERRIGRLEDVVGKHQQFHGHMTDY